MRECTPGIKYIPMTITGDKPKTIPAISNFLLFLLDESSLVFIRSILPQTIAAMLGIAIKIIRSHIVKYIHITENPTKYLSILISVSPKGCMPRLWARYKKNNDTSVIML